MRLALVLSLGTAITTIALPLAGAAAAATAAVPAADPTVRQPGWTPPRHPWGAPDLSGYWTNATITPVARNPKLTDKRTLPIAEARAVEKTWAAALEDAEKPTDPNASTQALQTKASDAKLLQLRPDFAAAGGDVGSYNAYRLDH